MADQGLKLESFWTRNSGLLVTVIVIVVFTLGMLQDLFLVREGFSRWSLIALSNVVNGVIAGALFYQYVRNEKMKRELIRERMHTIAELNHHIRNALQVIKFWGAQHQECKLDDLQIQLMKDSVDRIEWALRELLPSYPGDGDGGNADTRVQPPADVGVALPSARRLPQQQNKPH
jgi:hypothetical protein